MTQNKYFPSKLSARLNYDRMSRWYDLFTFNTEQPLTKRAIKALQLKQGESILEIGCGTGTSLLQMVQLVFPNGRVAGLDLSYRMLQHARKKLPSMTTGKIIRLVQGDGEFIPIASGKIDAILLSFTLELFDSDGISAVLDECRRVLTSSGRIGVIGLSREPGNTMPVRIYDWFHNHYPRWIDCSPMLIQQTLAATGYNIQSSSSLRLFGLPVEIVIAKV